MKRNITQTKDLFVFQPPVMVLFRKHDSMLKGNQQFSQEKTATSRRLEIYITVGVLSLDSWTYCTAKKYTSRSRYQIFQRVLQLCDNSCVFVTGRFPEYLTIIKAYYKSIFLAQSIFQCVSSFNILVAIFNKGARLMTRAKLASGTLNFVRRKLTFVWEDLTKYN